MIKLFKVLFGLYFFGVSLTFACDLNIVQLNVDEDWIKITNESEHSCKWVLEVSGNVYSSTSLGKRIVNAFVLSGWTTVILGNETGDYKVKLQPSLRLSSKGGIIEVWFDGVKMDFKSWSDDEKDSWSNEGASDNIWEDINIFDWTLKVEEIHPQGEVQYVELVAYGNVKGSLEVKGLGRWAYSKTIDIVLWSWNRLILVDTPQRLSRQSRQEGVQIVYIPGLSLTDKWEDLEFRLNGRLTSKIRFISAQDGKSLYLGRKEWERQIFDKPDTPSPALDLQFLKSLKTNSSTFSGVKCGIKWQHANPLYGHNSLNLIAQWEDKDLSNQTSKFKCEWVLPNGQKIDKCNPSYISDLGSGLFKIKLIIREVDTNFYCETFSYINLPSKPISPSCKEKYYQNLYLHRKEKYNKDMDMSRQCRQSQDKSKKMDVDLVPISIEKILPNPYGKDEGREKIWIKVHKAISLENYFVKIKNKKTWLHGSFESGKVFDIQWNLRLTNYGGCVELGSRESIFQKICYLNSQEGEILSWNKLLPQLDMDLSILKALSISKLKIDGDQACLVYHKKEIKCVPLKYTYQQYKKLTQEKKKLEKENDRLAKQITKNRSKFLKKEAKLLAKIASLKKKVSKYQKLYHTYKQKSKNNYFRYLQTTRSKNQKIKILSQRIKLYKNWNKYIAHLFKDEWYPLRKEYDMSTKYEVLTKLDKLISQGNSEINLKDQLVKSRDVERYFKVYYTPSFLFVYENKKAEILKNIRKPLNYLVWYQWP